jgi:hypothetical protein
MIATPFFRVSAGADVSPDLPATTGSVNVSVQPPGKSGSAFPNTARVASAKFWPLNASTNPFGPYNQLNISLNPLTTSGTTPNNYWVCYGGWNANGLDVDGVSVVGTARPLTLLALYNHTPYIVMWGVTDTATSFLQSGQRLLPGACAALEGAPRPVYYLDGGTWKYDVMQGVSIPGSHLHVRCLSLAPTYDRTTAAPLSGYLEIVAVQANATPAYWLP